MKCNMQEVERRDRCNLFDQFVRAQCCVGLVCNRMQLKGHRTINCQVRKQEIKSFQKRSNCGDLANCERNLRVVCEKHTHSEWPESVVIALESPEANHFLLSLACRGIINLFHFQRSFSLFKMDVDLLQEPEHSVNQYESARISRTSTRYDCFPFPLSSVPAVGARVQPQLLRSLCWKCQQLAEGHRTAGRNR